VEYEKFPNGEQDLEAQKNHSDPKKIPVNQYDSTESTVKPIASKPLLNESALREDDTKYLLDFGELEMDKELGRGAFGVVFKGTWRGSPVAIKQLLNQEFLGEKELEEFQREAKLMKSLRPHVNIVTFLGITSAPNPLCIVTEFMGLGSLQSFLQKQQTLSTEQLKTIITGIAAGICHLHREGIVHRDLAARNVLMSTGFQVKVSDFGMSRITSSGAGKTKTETGPLKWMAPECLKHRIYSNKSDAWAFGITIWETVCLGAEPYPGLMPVEAAVSVADGVLKSDMPKNCPALLEYVMQECWKTKPEDRPDFDTITKWLTSAGMEEWESTMYGLRTSAKSPTNPKLSGFVSLGVTAYVPNQYEVSPSTDNENKESTFGRDVKY